MQKYLTIFAVSWQNEFTYRLNFILWRLRNILRFLMVYFLWQGIFLSNKNVFGYSQSQMFTYVFMVLVVQTLVLSAPSSDSIGGEISNGDLSNYLVKPINYLKYWFTRDLSSKLFNLMFATVEISLMWAILHPVVQLPNNFLNILGFIFSCLLAIGIYFFVVVSSRFVAFWAPEGTWAIAFVIIVLIEILAGGIFPLDILPKNLNILLQLTPFPYFLYYPIAIFVGKISGWQVWQILGQSLVWLMVMYWFTKMLWQKGLKTYSAFGR